MSTYFSATELLAPPTERAAFSDRQAYVCAELSKLAYFKFEGGHTLEQALGIAREILGGDGRLALLEQQLRVVLPRAPSSAAEGEAALRTILKGADFELVKTFSCQGTQAFFCIKKVEMESGSEKKIAFLAYRGTEPKDFQDIKADARAALKEVPVGDEVLLLHSGYHEAYEKVQKDVEEVLAKTSYDQLFLTGHSLGGALAQVTTRILASSISGACYTFGAPPIGTIEVQNKLRTPIYEIINEVDIVPRLPNPWLAGTFLIIFRLIRLLAKSITVLQRVLMSGTWDERLEAFMEAMTKYRHPGYQSYLVDSGKNARLRVSVDSIDRLKWYLSIILKSRIWAFNKMAGDHSIDVYVDKLREHALKRI
jgi:pimeloyl-ACP methyl ester carboxylesterase